MRRLHLYLMVAVATTATAAVRSHSLLQSRATDIDARIDRVFARWTDSTPGCAVGAAVESKPVLARGYGMADLEHDVKITPDTIFEAGSVSKQFTAAATLLLARDHRLSLDDPARKYVPELPDYGAPLTIRHMLTHTSGLRDWGSVEAIAGWPRGSRTYTHAHVLEIVSRQRSLNFTPGTKWSYSNTGYNLAAIIVSRVSGMPFAEFTRQYLFEPLGMSHTSWRDDYTRIVKRRAIAYAERNGEFHTDMPFENVHGNGGLLTTVGDLLKWNENFTTAKIGDPAFVALQQQPGTFNDGRPHGYAFGLMINTTGGNRVVEHSGSTAGYTAHLVRYPDQRVSVAVLCNVNTGNATARAHEVADVYLAARIKASRTASALYTLTPQDIDSVVGRYRNTDTGMLLDLEYDKNRGGLLVQGPRVPLIPVSGTHFVTAGNDSWRIDPDLRLRATDRFGTTTTYERARAATPDVDELRELVGTYVSDEAETTLVAAVEGTALVLKRRPDTTLRLNPAYPDAFTAPGLGVVIVRRGTGGRVAGLSVVQDRVWDLRFDRRPAVTATSPHP